MLKTKVENFKNDNGKDIANQFIITDGDKMVFQSYKTYVAIKNRHGVILDTKALNYSTTTSKYLFRFLDMKRKEIENGIADGTIEVQNLN